MKRKPVVFQTMTTQELEDNKKEFVLPPRDEEEYKLKLANRFQNKPWYIKLWRYRWYIPIPFKATRSWLHGLILDIKEPIHSHNRALSFKTCWSIHVGMAQGDMEWFYTMDEVMGDFRSKITSPQSTN